MPSFEERKCWVTISDRSLPEYATESATDEEGRKIISCWIPSETDVKFQVHTAGPSHPVFRLREILSIDGRAIGGNIVSEESPLCQRVIDGCTSSTTTGRPFVFASMPTTDDEAHYRRPTRKTQLGTIVVEVFTYVPGETVPVEDWVLPGVPEIIHEREKKAIDHTMRFGTPFEDEPPPQVYETVGLYIEHIVTFKFRYRPLSVLQARGLAPRPSPPGSRTPTAATTNGITDTDADENEIVERIRTLEAEVTRLRQKQRGQVKQEDQIVLLNYTPGDVIDLTSEDDN